MTAKQDFAIPNSRAKYMLLDMSEGNVAFCLTSIFMLILAFLKAELVMEGITRGMSICVKSLLPSLFPFMVISSLLASSEVPVTFGRLLAKPMNVLFGISGEGGCALLLGILCGFPVGTKSAVTLYENKKIDRPQLEHLLMLCNIPSSAFLINTVGLSFFGNKEFGVELYLINIISTVIIGIISKPFFKNKIAHAPIKLKVNSKKQSGIALFTNAITDSAMSMLYICAFVLFFSAITNCLNAFISAFPLPAFISPLWLGFFEMTQGVSSAARIAPEGLGMLSAAIVSGWSGLSVHFQIMSICKSHTLSFRPYFLAKAATALFNASLFTLLSLVL
jgi:sporulation integral membrane protein YlbJ